MNSTSFLLVLLLLVPAVQAQNSSGRIEAAFHKFWAAGSPDEAERAADEVVKTGVSFDEALRRLKAGRQYAAQKTGVIKQIGRASCRERV